MLLSATKSRKKQQTELVQSVIHAEEEKRRKERKIFHITSVPVLYRAAYEPSLYHGTSDEHEDRKYLKQMYIWGATWGDSDKREIYRIIV